MVCQSPERNWDRIGASHPDHLAAGEAAIQAVYPDARNPFAFTDLLDTEGLQPHRVKEVWMMGFAHPDHWVDITDTFELKMKALHAHASQTAHNKELENIGSSLNKTIDFSPYKLADIKKDMRMILELQYSYNLYSDCSFDGVFWMR
jgi:LmbE family N-acetylglucosaminyl deacetylase